MLGACRPSIENETPPLNTGVDLPADRSSGSRIVLPPRLPTRTLRLESAKQWRLARVVPGYSGGSAQELHLLPHPLSAHADEIGDA